MKKKKTKTIKNALYLYSSREVPIKLLESLAKIVSDFDPQHKDREGRVGIIGVRKEHTASMNVPHNEMTDHEKCLEVGVRKFREIIYEMRANFPDMSLDEWYLFALAVFRVEPIKAESFIRTNRPKSWDEYKKKASWGVKFAERVWNEFRQVGGVIT